MMKSIIKNFIGLIIFSFSIQAIAKDTISVQVKTNEETAAALGFTVDGKKSGARGKSYSGKGPANRVYVFGYRKNSAFGPDILCGSQKLAKDSVVTLVTSGDHCSIEIE
ncbi:Uncharacterised protein [Legionella steigerwaltii]|uniref:Secreted protein n=1 Tax=Legionella steigerwaltii TaxID=460 RepID=A0A378LCA5_9GAMM|nr:hypothetical protein [Legionella steigerwaltii]KTD69957.1 hypothetical protein Lstg_3398 [Legionella steigerwaltii]STY21731.1 Uncharacterised protein [Legionella steigerwaltii]